MADEERRARIRLSAQNGAARALMASDTVAEAVPAVLAAVCENLGWTVGAVWQRGSEAGELTLSEYWSDPAADVRPFTEASRAVRFTTGMGLPGRVWAERRAAWIADVQEDPNFSRLEGARRSGLHGGFAVPIPVGDALLGVMEFYTRDVIQPDEELLATMEALGSQLGQFVRRRRVEAELRDSEERFRTFAATVPDATFVIDERSRIVFVNEAVRRIFGYDPDELVGEPLTRLMPERHRKAHRAGVARFIETGERHVPWDGVELPGLRRDGTEVPLEITYGTYAKDGARFFTGIARDITERKRAESRVRFQAHLLDAVGEAVIATDLEGRILYWNAFAEQLYGWEAGEVLGRDIAEVTPSELSRAHARQIMERLRAGETWSGEFLVRNRSGREFPVLVVDSPILDGGELVGVVGVSTEITDRKRREEAQRFLADAGRRLAGSLDVETTLRAVVRLAVPALGEHAYVCAYREDAEGLTTVARYSREGSEADEVLERLLTRSAFVRDVLHQEEALTLHADALAAAIPGGTLDRLGIGAVLATPLRARGESLGVLTVARSAARGDYDAHDRTIAGELARRCALALDNARLYEEAQEGNRAKADFLAVVSHELRTPLNAITGYADLMVGGITGDLNEKQTLHMERIKLGARHLAQLIDEILAYARVEAGRESVASAETDLGEVAREAVGVMLALAREKGLDLRCEVPDPGPVIRTDAPKVRQILVNLLSNGIKYTDRGEVVVAVEPREDGGARVTVRDTGIGIRPEDRERVFEAFWQAQSPNTRTVGGTGLGLSVSQRLVDLLGGAMSLTSETGEGSTFTVILPAEVPGGSQAGTAKP